MAFTRTPSGGVCGDDWGMSRGGLLIINSDQKHNIGCVGVHFFFWFFFIICTVGWPEDTSGTLFALTRPTRRLGSQKKRPELVDSEESEMAMDMRRPPPRWLHDIRRR